MSYEKRFGNWLNSLQLGVLCHGPWIEFEDANGHGFAQPDWLLAVPGVCLVVLECKVTYTPFGVEQLRNLYLPLCESLFSCPISLVLAAKNLGSGFETTGIARTESLNPPSLPRAPVVSLFNWLGLSDQWAGVE